jgi:predicted acylesterase/phospholipase RssA
MKDVSVVLGGGGAKGLVHVGVLEEIVTRGYRIVAIFGTSIGSIVGALFAYYASIGEFRELPDAQLRAVRAVKDVLMSMDFLQLADINLTSLLRRGLIKGRRVRQRLEVLLMKPMGTSSVTFDEIDFDLNVTITNARNGSSIVINRITAPCVPVAAAVRASMSIQGVFLEETIEYNGEAIQCWDGGVTGNCRFDLSYEKYPNLLTIASSVTYGGDPRELPNGFWMGILRPFRVADRSADFWLCQIESLTEHLLGAEAMRQILVVRPDVAGITTSQFWLSRQKRLLLFANGRKAVVEALKDHER